MKYLDLSCASPADNLALDEALLDACDAGGDEVLRFWESPVPFVVVGYGNSVGTEVNISACESRHVPVLRRCSGGGTVVQGPGCLNYSLILRADETGPLRNITSTNRHIMERLARCLSLALGENVKVQGHTDLAIAGIKFSGNAQRRKRVAVLFHGTFLLSFDLALVPQLLPMPSRQPDYRVNRPHGDFIRNIKISPEMVKAAVTTEWNAREPLAEIPWTAVEALVRTKYALRDWNLRF